MRQLPKFACACNSPYLPMPLSQGGDSAPVQAKPEKAVTKAIAKPASPFGRAISVLLPILLVLIAIFLNSQKK